MDCLLLEPTVFRVQPVTWLPVIKVRSSTRADRVLGATFAPPACHPHHWQSSHKSKCFPWGNVTAPSDLSLPWCTMMAAAKYLGLCGQISSSSFTVSKSVNVFAPHVFEPQQDLRSTLLTTLRTTPPQYKGSRPQAPTKGI